MFLRLKNTSRWAFACCAVAIGFEGTATAADWTTITGQVLLPKDEKIPEMKPITPDKDKEACNKNGPFGEESFIVNPKNRGIKNVVVYLVPEGFKRGDKFPVESIHPDLKKSAKSNVDIDQPCCSFVPHILLMRDDQSLTIKNSASVPHNAKLAGTSIDINPLIPSGGAHVVAKMAADIFPNALSCSIHGWMNAKVFAFDHPYFAVTDDDGKFEIKDAPVGKFNIVFWQESSGWSKNGMRGGQTIPLKPLKTALDPIDFILKK